MEITKLVIGAAGKKDPAAITLDIDPRHHPDVLHDLNKTPWPFKDDRFETIICHHVLEHLCDLPPVMRELHRICGPRGFIYIETPHYSSWMANSPEHKMRFSYFSLDSYIADKPKNWLNTDFKFALLERRITFHRAYRRYFLQRLWNRFPFAYERFWTYLFPAEHLIFKIRPIKQA